MLGVTTSLMVCQVILVRPTLLRELYEELERSFEKVEDCEKKLKLIHAKDEDCQRLSKIDGEKSLRKIFSKNEIKLPSFLDAYFLRD